MSDNDRHATEEEVRAAFALVLERHAEAFKMLEDM